MHELFIFTHTEIMSYSFNEKKFSQLCEDRHLNNVMLQELLGMTNTTPINNWRGGGRMYSSHIVRVCNAFNISPAEFFLQDEEPLHAPELEPTTCNGDSQYMQVHQTVAHVEEKAKIEKQYMKEISDMKCEHIRELMQKDIDLARREAEIREEIRREMRDEYESQITTLRNQLLDLTAQYRELELTSSSYSKITAVADNKGSNYIAKK